MLAVIAFLVRGRRVGHGHAATLGPYAPQLGPPLRDFARAGQLGLALCVAALCRLDEAVWWRQKREGALVSCDRAGLLFLARSYHVYILLRRGPKAGLRLAANFSARWAMAPGVGNTPLLARAEELDGGLSLAAGGLPSEYGAP